MMTGARTEEARGFGVRELLHLHGSFLLRIAAASIDHGLDHGAPLAVDPLDHPAELRADGASFVTLTADGELRGCVGSAQARRPLVEDVAVNAFAAAFCDDRFARMTVAETRAGGLALSISVLSALQPVAFADEAGLLAALRPGIDGLVIQVEGKRALFLPQVWEVLPTPEVFLRQLKAKAGFSQRFWSDDVRAWRFTTNSVSSVALAEPLFDRDGERP